MALEAHKHIEVRNRTGKALAPCDLKRANQMVGRKKAVWVVEGKVVQLVYTKDDERFIRNVVLHRDKYVCHLCDQHGADTVDHLVPLSKGGTEHPDNKKAAHKACNNLRGDTDLDAFLRLRDSGHIVMPTFPAPEV